MITVTPSANGCNGTTEPTQLRLIRRQRLVVLRIGSIVMEPRALELISLGLLPAVVFHGPRRLMLDLEPVESAIFPAYTANNTGTSPVTATITVTPTANGCTGTPATFTVTVNPTTVITAQPSNITVCPGGNATFSVGATGLGLTYQWQVHTTGSSYANIPGATSSSYTISPVSASNANTYRVIVSGTCGSITSGIVTLTVNSLPSCNITGTSVICSGTTTSFSAPAGMAAYFWTSPTGFTTIDSINRCSQCARHLQCHHYRCQWMSELLFKYTCCERCSWCSNGNRRLAMRNRDGHDLSKCWSGRDCRLVCSNIRWYSLSDRNKLIYDPEFVDNDDLLCRG